MAERHGERVIVIGQSRGGVFARALAARRPDLVEGIVTLGSPTVSQLAVHPLVLAQVGLVGALGTRARAGHVPLELPARRVLRGLPRRDRGPVPARTSASSRSTRKHRRHRRLARLPRPRGRRARRGPRLALRHGRQRPGLPRRRRRAARASAATIRCSRTTCRARPSYERLGDRRVHRGAGVLDDLAVAGREAGRVERAQRLGGLERGRAVPGGRSPGAGSAGWASPWWRRRRASSRRRRRTACGRGCRGRRAGRGVAGRGDDLERADALARRDRARRLRVRAVAAGSCRRPARRARASCRRPSASRRAPTSGPRRPGARRRARRARRRGPGARG